MADAPTPNPTEENQKKLEAAKKQLAENRERQAATAQPTSAEGSKPTPSQDENDLAKLGAHLTEHEPDGSPEQPSMHEQHRGKRADDKKQEDKQSKPAAPAGGAGYQTRATTPTSPPSRSE